MTVTLYQTSDDPRVVTKAMTSIATVTAKPTENCSIINPQLILNNSSTPDLTSANYMYISDWSRYYFIDNIVMRPGREIELQGSIDVLTTYDTEIRSCTATVVRSQSVGKPTMIPDNKLPIDPNKKELLTAVSSFHPSGANLYLVRVKESTIKYNPQQQRGDDNGT